MIVVIFFFFKQKTAYEITTGDWSSDVCSSDLGRRERPQGRQDRGEDRRVRRQGQGDRRSEERRVGKSVGCCVDLGGRRIIKKKKKTIKNGRKWNLNYEIKKSNKNMN